MVEGKKTACLPGGLNTSPTPGRPRWRQSREENRKWETATAEQRNAGMEDRMEGRVQWPAVGETDRPGVRSGPPDRVAVGPTGPVKPRPVTQREDKAGLSGRLGPLPGRGEAPAAPRARQPGSLWESGSKWDARD